MDSRKEEINELRPVYYISEVTKTARIDRSRVRIRWTGGRRSREKTGCGIKGKFVRIWKEEISKQERQRTYNVTLRRVRATIIAVEKSSKYYMFLVCVCSLWYPACNAHATYWDLWSVRLYDICPYYLLLHIKCVSIFSTSSVWNIYSSKKNWARHNKNVHRSSCKVSVILVRF
jgi:hypothetical protein